MTRFARWGLCALCALLGAANARGQSPQAALQGQVINQASGQPLSSAVVIYRNLLTNSQGYRYTNEHGFYSFPALAPGPYSVRVDALGFQAEERMPVELPVAGRIELNFALLAGGPAQRPAGATATPQHRADPAKILAILYGADAAVPPAAMVRLPLPQVDTLAGSISSVIDENQILELPLAGRDVYALLVAQPDVTSDSATARGLGFSVNGQQAASSNFLLDGVDNNDLQATGPGTRVSADAVKEYRMSTNNFAAEFGRASGAIASVVTRSGTNLVHGTLFEFFNHHRLNANSFGNNFDGLPREPVRQHQYGGSVGGPLRRDRAFFFGNFEQLRISTRSNSSWLLMPSPQLISLAAEGTIAKRLLTHFPPPAGRPLPAAPLAALVEFPAPFRQLDTFALGRVDTNLRDGRHRLSGRYAISLQDQDLLGFSPYPGFDEPLALRGHNVSVNYTAEAYGGFNELKFGLNRHMLDFFRSHPEIPALTSGDGILLPGSQTASDFFSRDTVLHVVDNFSRLSGRHALGFGFEWRPYLHDSLRSPARDGRYSFDSSLDFVADRPSTLEISVLRQSGLPAADSAYRRYYFSNEWAGFFQDNMKLTRRLTLNLGVRWEYFGVPQPRKGTEDYNFVFGQGRGPGERIANGRIASGALFEPDRNNIAPRFGFAFDLSGSGRSVLRGGYGVFFDRIFNDFWMETRRNILAFRTLVNIPGLASQFGYTLPARAGVLPPTEPVAATSTVAVDRRLRTPYGQAWFLGLQHEARPNLVLEVSHSGSVGRKLAATDVINREFSLPSPETREGRFNPDQPDISYRSNQGQSDHVALQVALNRRWTRGLQFQASYTYGRTRDVQSDPFARTAGTETDRRKRLSNLDPFFRGVASFARQFDPAADYGHSDFDQTHNLALSFITQSPIVAGFPRFFSGWQAAGLIGIRSGRPFSVITNDLYIEPGSGVLQRNRAHYWGEDADDAFLTNRTPIPGGVVLLDAELFEKPSPDEMGNQARNALHGPAFWNVDVSFSRSFALPVLGEQASMQFRAEFFNLFNHINLNTPDATLESSTFGNAMYGRLVSSGSPLPSVAPLGEQPRRVQLALKVYF